MIGTIVGGVLVIVTEGKAGLQEETSMTAERQGDIEEEKMIMTEIVIVIATDVAASREISVSPSLMKKTAIDVSARKASLKTKDGEEVDQSQQSDAQTTKAPRVLKRKKRQLSKKNLVSHRRASSPSTQTKLMVWC